MSECEVCMIENVPLSKRPWGVGTLVSCDDCADLVARMNKLLNEPPPLARAAGDDLENKD